MATTTDDARFPCSLALRIPLPDPRLASAALDALHVDAELSPLVRRHLSLDDARTLLCVDYQATTNRMLRVAVNSFMDSVKLVLDVMEHLDVDVLAQHSVPH
ncbi:transcription factor pcc1 domain-containing protein [Hirsutella rhossiliensis]|uniref:Transcription factor pcc1 domain-containing protein n=1 Tax=Hirsutella rhossiliensis TaxID=111463 RepID=A0A9P8SGA1_9HYPO|nr:transcription factor pcc1 domain-containing protein [Hirsutella rhossiliensis]KAH0960919.1 transcription factor pcc1 domain-containing protein [Hirsutella rhossiliensis]